MLRSLTVLALVAVLATACTGQTEQPEPTSLPDITLPVVTGTGLNGEERSLADVRGPALVNLWASWCPQCLEEFPVIQEFRRRHPSIAVVGINFTDRDADAAATTIKRFGLDYLHLFDETGRINGTAPIPRVRGMPLWLFIDSSGRVTHRDFVQFHSVEHMETMSATHLPGAFASTASPPPTD